MNYNIDPNSRKEKLKKYARDLRKNMTPGEVRTWALLKEFPLNFNRQFIIGEYIVDFVCRELKLVIEIDGISHDQGKGLYDIYREKEITKLGWTVIRFREEYIMTEFESYKDSLGETLVYYMEKNNISFYDRIKDKEKNSINPSP